MTPDVPAYTPAEQAQYSPVHPAGTAPEAMASSTQDEASIFWNLGIPGFSVGGVQDSNIDENPYASTVSAAIRSTPVLAYTGGGTAFELASGVPAAGMTTTAAASAVGDTNVKVAAVTNLVAGQPFFIDVGQNIEIGQISAVGTAGATGTGVTLTAPLRFAHASGVPFHVNQGQPVGFTGDTLEHLNFFASGAPHGLDGEASPTEELLRALELPSQYTALLASGSDYLGAVPAPTGTIAYFETNPVKPTATKTVSFDASFARASDGGKAGLQYYWDFGDGTSGTGETVDPHLRVRAVGRREARRRQGRLDQVGHVPAGRRGQQPVGLGAGDAGLRHVLDGRAQRADRRREGRLQGEDGGITQR